MNCMNDGSFLIVLKILAVLALVLTERIFCRRRVRAGPHP